MTGITLSRLLMPCIVRRTPGLRPFIPMGTRPHRTVSISGPVSVSRMIGVCCEGVMLQRGPSPSGAVCSRLNASLIRDSAVCRVKRPHMPRNIHLGQGLLHVVCREHGVDCSHPLRGPEIRALRQLRRDYPETPYVFITGRKGPLSASTVRKPVVRAGWSPHVPSCSRCGGTATQGPSGHNSLLPPVQPGIPLFGSSESGGAAFARRTESKCP
jgi:hypothetical protein